MFFQSLRYLSGIIFFGGAVIASSPCIAQTKSVLAPIIGKPSSIVQVPTKTVIVPITGGKFSTSQGPDDGGSNVSVGTLLTPYGTINVTKFDVTTVNGSGNALSDLDPNVGDILSVTGSTTGTLILYNTFGQTTPPSSLNNNSSFSSAPTSFIGKYTSVQEVSPKDDEFNGSGNIISGQIELPNNDYGNVINNPINTTDGFFQVLQEYYDTQENPDINDPILSRISIDSLVSSASLPLDIGSIKVWIAEGEAKGYGNPNLEAYEDSKGLMTIGYGYNLDAHPPKMDRDGNEISEIHKVLGLNYNDVYNGTVTITLEQSDTLLQHSISTAIQAAKNSDIEDFDNLAPARQLAIIDMIYNMGEGKFSHFTNLIDAINNKDWDQAAYEMAFGKTGNTSKWYTDVHEQRAEADIAAMLTGKITHLSYKNKSKQNPK